MSFPQLNAIQGLATLVGEIGRPKFEDALLRVLAEVVGADHCTMYCVQSISIRVLGGASADGSDHARVQSRRYVRKDVWRRDPLMLQALSGAGENRRPQTLRISSDAIEDDEMRRILDTTPIRERVLLCSSSNGSAHAISVSRTDQHGSFAAREFNWLAQYSPLLLSMVAKHDAFLSETAAPSSNSLNPADLERRLESWNCGLTLRERQVCARILYGLSTEGVALDLDIGQTSVATYRQRAYTRLGIATRHELFRRLMS